MIEPKTAKQRVELIESGGKYRVFVDGCSVDRLPHHLAKAVAAFYKAAIETTIEMCQAKIDRAFIDGHDVESRDKSVAAICEMKSKGGS